MDGTRIRAMFGVIDAQDWAALPGFFHPEVVYERPGFPALVGVDRMMRFYLEERKIVRSAHHIEATAAEEGRAACWGRVEATLPDGSETTVGFADVYLVDHGLIRLRRTHFFTPTL